MHVQSYMYHRSYMHHSAILELAKFFSIAWLQMQFLAVQLENLQ